MALTVGQLARRTGVSPDTVRYYERVGLLPKTERTSSGYRSYDESHVERLQIVKGAQRVGLRLREVRELLEVMDRGLCPCGHAESLIRERLGEIDQEVSRLAELRGQLARLVERLPDPPTGGPWPCQTEFIRVGGGARDA